MRILIAAPTFPPQGGGVAEVVRRQQVYLAGRGHTVEVVSGALNSAPAQDGVRRFDVNSGRFPVYASGDRWGINSPAEKARYIQFLKEYPSDVILVHCWQAWCTDWAFEHVSEIGKPLALFSHGTSVNTFSGSLGFLRYLRWREYAWRTIPRILQAAAGVFVLEDHVDQDRFFDCNWARRLGVRTRVVSNGCSPELLDQPASECARDELIVLCVAQFTPEKNPAAVVDAFAKANWPGARLIICGSLITKYYYDLCQRIAILPVQLRERIAVEVGPDRNRLLQLYRQASIVVSASTTECQPLVLIDAMGAGVPYLSTRVGCVAALPGGVVAEQGDGFAKELRRLLSDPELRRELGDIGRSAAVHKYNWASSLALLDQGLVEIADSGVVHFAGYSK